jgi:hypothetical protein
LGSRMWRRISKGDRLMAPVTHLNIVNPRIVKFLRAQG